MSNLRRNRKFYTLKDYVFGQVFVSMRSGPYRKPAIGSWTYLLKQVCWRLLVRICQTCDSKNIRCRWFYSFDLWTSWYYKICASKNVIMINVLFTVSVSYWSFCTVAFNVIIYSFCPFLPIYTHVMWQRGKRLKNPVKCIRWSVISDNRLPGWLLCITTYWYQQMKGTVSLGENTMPCHCEHRTHHVL